MAFMETQKKALLRKFHALLTHAGMSNDDKKAMLLSYNAESSADLNVYELTELCGKLDALIHPAYRKEDNLRKRCIASICGYLKAAGYEYGDMTDAAKKIAVRVSGGRNFNSIPQDRLRSMIYAFNNRRKDMEEADRISIELLTGKQDNK